MKSSRALGRRHQRGVALISVILVVVVATVISVAQMNRQNLAIHRTRNMLDTSQAFQYALGGEELARQILYEDFQQEHRHDYLGEEWALPAPPFEFEEGEVEIQITDLQGLFNLNNLVLPPTQDDHVIRRQFIALLTTLGIDPMFADRVADWLDEDQNVRSLGAEDYEYLIQDPPYRTGLGLMADSSELRLMLEMDEDSFRALLPYVTVLPESDTKINVNTAPSIILQTIATDLSVEQAEAIVVQRDIDGGYQSIGEFTQLEGVTAATGIDTRILDVQSSYFLVNVRARYNERFSVLSSVIQRSPADGSMRVISRDIGQRFFSRVAPDEPVMSQAEEG